MTGITLPPRVIEFPSRFLEGVATAIGIVFVVALAALASPSGSGSVLIALAVGLVLYGVGVPLTIWLFTFRQRRRIDRLGPSVIYEGTGFLGSIDEDSSRVSRRNLDLAPGRLEVSDFGVQFRLGDGADRPDVSIPWTDVSKVYLRSAPQALVSGALTLQLVGGSNHDFIVRLYRELAARLAALPGDIEIE